MGKPAEIGDLDQAGMRDRSGGARLLHEARGDFAVGRQIFAQRLEREALAERAMTRSVHDAHAAFADHGRDLVAIVDHAAEQRIGRAVPIRRWPKRLAVERTEATVRRKVLPALRADGRARPLPGCALPLPRRPRLRTATDLD